MTEEVKKPEEEKKPEEPVKVTIKQPQSEQKAALSKPAGSPSAKVDPMPSPAVPKGNVVSEDSWMYHPKFAPILLKKGEEIPDGYGHKNPYGWFKNPKNNFNWEKR